DQYLKGARPAEIARVTAFEPGTNRWLRLADWPPACARGCPANLTPLYLAAGQRLSFDPPAAQTSQAYISDPARPVPYRMRPTLAGYELPIAMDVIRRRHRTDPARPAPLTPNAPMTYEFALPAASYVVQPGHRLMIQVQSSWFPLYDRNPQTFVPNIFYAKTS